MSPGIIRRTRVVFVSWLTLDFALHLLSDFVILPQDKKTTRMHTIISAVFTCIGALHGHPQPNGAPR